MSSSKTIAKNTLFLYFRMFISMGISLYTSRVVLDVLGIEDFGIYNVVGGVVAMFSFLTTSMSGSTSRFLTFELGKRNFKKLQDTFSTSLIIHFIISIIILILGETIGLWFLNNKLTIPPDRMNAAHWILQFSILNAMIAVIQVPYSALIIAHEKMSVFAYIEISNTILKLVVVFILMLGNFDKLILYGGLISCVASIIFFTYKTYCSKKFIESKFHFIWEKKLLKPILSFSGWDLYGNLSVIARTQGVNILLNIFHGPLLNAASGVASQVQGAVMAFASNVVTAVRPQIVKSYATGEIQTTIKLILIFSKFIFSLLLIISLPAILEMNFILNIWLKEVPIYAVIFSQYTLIFNFFATLSLIVVSAIHATGNIKRPSLINGTLYLLVIPITYISFKNDGTPEIPYILNAIFVFIGMMSNVYTFKLYVPKFSIKNYLVKVSFPCFFTFIITFMITFYIQQQFDESWGRLAIIIATSSFLVILLTYLLLMDKEMKFMLKSSIYKLMFKNR